MKKSSAKRDAGIVTPSEIMLGLKVFKFFPAEAFGGLKAIKKLCGPVGLTCIKFLSLASVKNPVACDIIPEKLQQAKLNGAARKQVMQWMAEGKLNIKDFISDYYVFADSVQAYEDLLSRKILKKGIIKFI